MTNITEISPYLARESKRLGIISSKAEYKRGDYFAERKRSDAVYVPLVKSDPPLESWAGGFLFLVALAIGGVALVVFLWGVSDALRAAGWFR